MSNPEVEARRARAADTIPRVRDMLADAADIPAHRRGTLWETAKALVHEVGLVKDILLRGWTEGPLDAGMSFTDHAKSATEASQRETAAGRHLLAVALRRRAELASTLALVERLRQDPIDAEDSTAARHVLAEALNIHPDEMPLEAMARRIVEEKRLLTVLNRNMEATIHRQGLTVAGQDRLLDEVARYRRAVIDLCKRTDHYFSVDGTESTPSTHDANEKPSTTGGMEMP